MSKPTKILSVRTEAVRKGRRFWRENIYTTDIGDMTTRQLAVAIGMSYHGLSYRLATFGPYSPNIFADKIPSGFQNADVSCIKDSGNWGNLGASPRPQKLLKMKLGTYERQMLLEQEGGAR